MALGKPIISTALPECKQYQSVLIANSHEQFCKLISDVLDSSGNTDFLSLLEQDAMTNSWEIRASKIKQVTLNHQG